MKGTLIINHATPVKHPNADLRSHINLDGRKVHLFEAGGQTVLELLSEQAKIEFDGDHIHLLGMTTVYRDGYAGPVKEYVSITFVV